MKFFYNGIKGSDGKLQKCSYGEGPWINLPGDVITIYGRSYVGFSKEVHEAFKIENDSDSRTDYFENDKIRVFSSHPLYNQVKSAVQAGKARDKKIALSRADRGQAA